MEQLKHFGIKTQFIRKDTSTYNKRLYEGDECPKCHNEQLETYNNDKDNSIVLFCPGCNSIISKAKQR